MVMHMLKLQLTEMNKTILGFCSLSLVSYPIWKYNGFLTKGEVEGGSSKATKMNRETKGMISIPLPNRYWKKRKKPRDVAGEKWRQAMEQVREEQEAHVTPLVTSHHFLGSEFTTAGKENPQSPPTQFFSRSQDRKQSVSPPFVWYLAAVLKNTS